MLTLVNSADAQQATFIISPEGSYCLPFGPNAEAFTYGASGALSVLARLSSAPYLSLGGVLDFNYIEQQSGNRVYDIEALAAFRTELALGTFASFFCRIAAGASLSLIEWRYELLPMFNLAGEARAGIDLHFTPTFGIGLYGGYEYHNVYNGMSFGVNILFGFGEYKPIVATPENPATGQPDRELDVNTWIEIGKIELNEIFPVLYKYYDNHPVGTVWVRNVSSVDIPVVTVNASIDDYMSLENSISVPGGIRAGETKAVKITALLKKTVLELQEADLVRMRIEVVFNRGMETGTVLDSNTVRIHKRNALTWDDDKKAAAFVSPTDDIVLSLAKKVSGIMSDCAGTAINADLAAAIGIHEALEHFGLRYVRDPSTPYDMLSQSDHVIDYLQFPRQTLSMQAGDCDDLAILYCSLLESVNIETAFITVPSHIYIAFSLGDATDVLAKPFIWPDEVIVREDGTAWMPLEVTMIGDDFLKAWKEGARQWREASDDGSAAFYPIREAWTQYEAVGSPGNIEGFKVPDIEDLRERSVSGYHRFVDWALQDQVEDISNQMAQQGDIPRLANQLGVLYASFGRYEKARPYFQSAAATGKYFPALCNLGNLLYQESDFYGALVYYERAEALLPERPEVVFFLARTNHQLENYGTTRTLYEKLRVLSPHLAEQHSYLKYRGEDRLKASAVAGLKREMIWMTEEEE